MKPVIMLITDWWPYCKQASRWMEELKKEDPKYLNVEVIVIDEEVEPEKAKKYDYYYVPTYYVEDTKLHEGVPTKEIVREVFEAALK